MNQMSPEEIRFFLLDLDSKTVIPEPLLVCVHLTKSVTSPAAYWDTLLHGRGQSVLVSLLAVCVWRV